MVIFPKDQFVLSISQQTSKPWSLTWECKSLIRSRHWLRCEVSGETPSCSLLDHSCFSEIVSESSVPHSICRIQQSSLRDSQSPTTRALTLTLCPFRFPWGQPEFKISITKWGRQWLCPGKTFFPCLLRKCWFPDVRNKLTHSHPKNELRGLQNRESENFDGLARLGVRWADTPRTISTSNLSPSVQDCLLVPRRLSTMGS